MLPIIADSCLAVDIGCEIRSHSEGAVNGESRPLLKLALRRPENDNVATLPAM